MEYKVVPFVATASQHNLSSSKIAQQLDDLIQDQNIQGWKYVRLESVSTFVQPIDGCFGVGGKPGYMTSYQMAVFAKEENEKPSDSSH